MTTWIHPVKTQRPSTGFCRPFLTSIWFFESLFTEHKVLQKSEIEAVRTQRGIREKMKRDFYYHLP